MKRKTPLLTVLAATLLLAGHPAAGESAERAKIGLALSGGGARGAAHIGVIRVLEELRIPVDYIAGTSMGSIAGGLYAMGMSPEELEAALLAVDWDAAFRDSPEREDQAFRRKEDQDLFPVSVKLGWRDRKLRMSRGLLEGQNLNAIFTALTLPVATVEDFDRLAIPYRAVGTDIATGDRVVLGEGSLAQAMRASMGVPGVFAPVEIDGRLVVDGGIAANLPIDVVREMGADIVIAVDISTPLAPKEKLNSALSIVGQVTTILTTRNTELQIATLDGDDLLIRPPLGDLGSGDFSRAAEAVGIGEKAAREAAANLARLSLPQEDFARHLAARRRPAPDPPVIDFVRVESDHGFTDSIITSRLRVVEGQPLDYDLLSQDVDRIYGMGMFERIATSVVEEEGRKGLVVRTVRKSWGPNYIHFGLELESDDDGGASFNVRTRLNMTEINRLGAEWRNDIQIGENPRFVSEFYQPLKAFSGYFVAPRLELERDTIFLFAADSDEASSSYRVGRIAAALDIGKEFGSWGELRLGVERERGNAELQTGVGAIALELPFDPEDLEDDTFDSGSYSLRFAWDLFDDLDFPRKGQRGSLGVRFFQKHLGAEGNFETLEGRLAKAVTVGRNTVVLAGRGGTVFNGDAPIQDTFALGGFLQLSGLVRNQLRGQHLLLGDVIVYRQVAGFSTAPPNMPVFLGFSLEAGNVWQDTDDIRIDEFLAAGSVFLGVDTVLGPAFLAYGLAEGGRSAGYFFLGRGF
jgi:NTE family protein